jgi:uncharacterized protein (DUF305 family)
VLARLEIAILALAVVAACAQGSGRTQTPSSAIASAAPTASAPAASAPASVAASELDLAFIDMMVPHHEAAVEMARMAQDRAEHEELVEMAAGIMTEQEREIGQLKAWRLTWFGSDETPPMAAMPVMPGVEIPGMGGHDMGGQTMDMTGDIERLRTAEPFDHAFLRAMIEHHQSAIDAAAIIVAETRIDDLRELADRIISSQQAEIDEMEAWLVQWYPDAT